MFFSPTHACPNTSWTYVQHARCQKILLWKLGYYIYWWVYHTRKLYIYEDMHQIYIHAWVEKYNEQENRVRHTRLPCQVFKRWVNGRGAKSHYNQSSIYQLALILETGGAQYICMWHFQRKCPCYIVILMQGNFLSYRTNLRKKLWHHMRVSLVTLEN